MHQKKIEGYKMEEERFVDRLKRAGGCVWFLFAGFIIAGLFLIIAGSIIYAANRGTTDGSIAIMCIVLGVICEIFFLGIGVLLPYIQWKKGITAESTRVWQSGVLTDRIIKKDIRAHKKTRVIGWFVATGLLLLLAAPIVTLSEEFDLGTLFMAVIPFVTLAFAIKELWSMNRELSYRIVDDCVVDSQVKKTFDVIDAATNHLLTETPTLYFKKHGEYPVDSMHIHAYYMPEEIISLFEKDEEVFIVYSNRTNKILHIYRKKYWTLEK